MPFNATQFRRRDMVAQIADYGARSDTTTYEYGYRTADTPATVETANYFDSANYLQRGDIIIAVMNNGVGTTPVLKNYVVTQAISYGDAHNVIALQTATAG